AHHRRDHVRRVEPTAEPDLDDRDVDAGIGERAEAYRGRRLEEGRLGRADVWPESLCGREQRRLLDGRAIDADPLAERGQVRRGVETGAVTGGVQDTGDRRGDTALPIRAADVDRRV